VNQICFPHKILVAICVSVFCAGTLLAAGPKRKTGRKTSSLSARVQALLQSPGAAHGFWGIEVVQLPAGRVLFQRDANHLFIPASNMKLFTTAAALEKLGPDYTFRTTVEAAGLPDAVGRVDNLILVGRGDPNLGSRLLPYRPNIRVLGPADRVFQELADMVKARGVNEVAGDIIADDTYFVYIPFAPDWAQDDLQWGYGAPITALAFNDNSLTLHIIPGAKPGDLAQVQLEPVPGYYQLNNRLVTGPAGATPSVYVERLPGSMRMDVWGEIGADSDDERESVAIADPPLLMGRLLREALEERGVKIDGDVIARETPRIAAATQNDPPPEPPRVVLAEHDSLPLREDVKLTDKVSENLHAEMLLRVMARASGKSGSAEQGLDLLRAFAAQVGADPAQTVFWDGSGLSRQDLVSPDALVKLLTYMARSANFPDFYTALPIAGVDGTLFERFRGTPAAGCIHAKTGSVEHVNTLSGYMDLPDGQRLAFSIMSNNQSAPPAKTIGVMDRVVLEIFQQFARRTAKSKKKRN
jgi:serine-type D-Ala-D-Ala carboxypeptidase/endopeptidase (penicillin-binding protein 4)